MSSSIDQNHSAATAGLTDSDLRGLVDGMGEGVAIAAPDGTIVYWNDAATRIFGWQADKALGQSLDLIIPEKNRRAHWDGYHNVMATGQTRYGDELLRVPALHSNGDRLSIAFSVHLITHPPTATGQAGPVKAIAAVIRDETQRWNEERELRRRLAALEAPDAQ